MHIIHSLWKNVLWMCENAQYGDFGGIGPMNIHRLSTCVRRTELFCIDMYKYAECKSIRPAAGKTMQDILQSLHFSPKNDIIDLQLTQGKTAPAKGQYLHRTARKMLPGDTERKKKMRIALMNENSQAAKNPMILASLKKVVEPMGHEVVNFGMYTAEDACQLTYVKIGLLACILLETKAVDYVVTGCGTGEGAMLACNSFPGVLCGHLCDPSDGYMFAHINDGNCVALPFAKDFGWGAELKLEMIFQQLFGFGHGQGYPKERVIPEQRNKKILDEVKKVTHRKLIDILHDIDQDFLKETISGEHFAELFYPYCQDEEVAAYLRSL